MVRKRARKLLNIPLPELASLTDLFPFRLFLFKTGVNGHLETVATIPVVADLELRINQSSTGEEDALSEQLGSPVEKSGMHRQGWRVGFKP